MPVIAVCGYVYLGNEEGQERVELQSVKKGRRFPFVLADRDSGLGRG